MLRRHPWHLTSGSAGRSAPSEQFSLKLVPCAHLRRIFSKLDEEEEAEESLDTYHVTYEFGNRCVHTIPHCPLLTATAAVPREVFATPTAAARLCCGHAGATRGIDGPVVVEQPPRASPAGAGLAIGGAPRPQPQAIDVVVTSVPGIVGPRRPRAIELQICQPVLTGQFQFGSGR